VSPPDLLPIQIIPVILRPECEANHSNFSSSEDYECLNMYLQYSVYTRSTRGQTYLFLLSYKISPYGRFYVLYHKSLQTFLFFNIFRFRLTFYQVLCVSMLHNASNSDLCVCHLLKTFAATLHVHIKKKQKFSLLKPVGYLCKTPHRLTFKNSTFGLHIVLLWLLYVSEHVRIIPLYSFHVRHSHYVSTINRTCTILHSNTSFIIQIKLKDN
jgi:hypothetical protein